MQNRDKEIPFPGGKSEKAFCTDYSPSLPTSKASSFENKKILMHVFLTTALVIHTNPMISLCTNQMSSFFSEEAIIVERINVTIVYHQTQSLSIELLLLGSWNLTKQISVFALFMTVFIDNSMRIIQSGYSLLQQEKKKLILSYPCHSLGGSYCVIHHIHILIL